MSYNKFNTRFAPSPSGYLHLGNAYSAMFAEHAAREKNGQFFLRIEDIDRQRCRPEFEESIKEDLDWLGLKWEKPVHRQSDHLENYQTALNALQKMQVLYPCFCTRKDIVAEISQANRASHQTISGPFGPIYPGTCRNISVDERQFQLAAGVTYALRIDVVRALSLVNDINWIDNDRGTVAAKPEIFGDVVLARKDIPTSYHLSVTVDDNLQKIALVTRGEDLRLATHIHRLLQELLGYDVPEYRFHSLLSGKDGRQYSKRNNSITLRTLRDSGYTPTNIREIVKFY